MRPRAGRAPRAAAAAATLAAAAVLAGCAAPIPTPNPDPEPAEPLPVLGVTQTEDVLTAVDEALAAGDEARDVDALRPRVEDPALAMRAAQYTLQERSSGERNPTPLTTSDQVLVIAATDGWPRTLLAVTEPPEGTTSPLLLTLRQDDPRAQYRLWSWARLFPGVETPPFASPEIGSAELPADATGFVATPAETVSRYADVLVKGSESEYAGQFASDPFVEQIRSSVDTARDNLDGIAEVSYAAGPVEGQVVALGTADEGAVVVGVLSTSLTVRKTLQGSTLRLGGELGQWLGDGTVPSIARATYTSIVAFEVPAAAEGATITVLGAERALVDVARQ
jgi:hypothetical protein